MWNQICYFHWSSVTAGLATQRRHSPHVSAYWQVPNNWTQELSHMWRFWSDPADLTQTNTDVVTIRDIKFSQMPLWSGWHKAAVKSTCVRLCVCVWGCVGQRLDLETTPSLRGSKSFAQTKDHTHIVSEHLPRSVWRVNVSTKISLILPWAVGFNTQNKKNFRQKLNTGQKHHAASNQRAQKAWHHSEKKREAFNTSGSYA